MSWKTANIKMAKKSKTLYIDLNVEEESIFSKFLTKKSSKEYNPSDIELLRKLFSTEKTRILYTIKKEKPSSIYHLAKLLKRDFKSVYQDLKVLERFGFIEFYSEKKGKKESLKPVLLANEINLVISI
jgi:predicted transcriptional regulator